ncbi:MAG: hypothetical protein JSR91_06535 [Proteobacteria bacterium]|nr:hypothetical protein [Pseudomonadota bacterium]
MEGDESYFGLPLVIGGDWKSANGKTWPQSGGQRSPRHLFPCDLSLRRLPYQECQIFAALEQGSLREQTVAEAMKRLAPL